ncbi:MAG: hypothetical protein ABIP48_08320 [Planctomycetota bacterium]
MNQQTEKRLDTERILRDFQVRQLRDSNVWRVPGSSLPGDVLHVVPSTNSLNLSGQATQAKRHAVITVYNPNKEPINYALRWGRQGEAEQYTVQADGWYWHSWSYDCNHAHEFPTPYICFDTTFTDDNPQKEYALDTYVASTTGPDYGKPYHFIIEDDGVHVDIKQGRGTTNPPTEAVNLKPLLALLGQTVPVSDRPAVKYGLSIITFDNQSGQPASVRLVGPTRAEVNVPSGGQDSIRFVAPGSYLIRVRSGTLGNYRYSEGDTFDVTQMDTTYSLVTVTLHPTPGGNYSVRDSSAADFLAACP